VNTYILDTHVLLWWLFKSGRLSYRATAIIRNSRNSLLISTASAWEIGTKHRIGKLPEADSIINDLPSLLQRARIATIDITLKDALLAGTLKLDHRDPFDRMIIAQGKLRDLPIITNDQVFHDSAADLALEIIW